MDNYRVPKRVLKGNIVKSASDDSYFRDILAPKINESLFNLKSLKSFEFLQIWQFFNLPTEAKYIACRKKMKNIESYGFIYYSDLTKVADIVETGEITVGNIPESHLSNSSMGVSLCLHADIYHPGNLSGKFPTNGSLLIVKYLQGKVNYVVPDHKPMEPQPQYNCHLAKSPIITSNTKLHKAYHSSQIFIYEYNEDGEIVKTPSQLLPVAAVVFNWKGPPILPIATHPDLNIYSGKSQRPAIISATKRSSSVKTLSKQLTLNINNKKLQVSNRSNIFSRNSTNSISTKLQIHNIPHQLDCIIYQYLLSKHIFPQFYLPNFLLSQLISIDDFTTEIRSFQFILHDRLCPDSNIDIHHLPQIQPQHYCYLAQITDNITAQSIRTHKTDYQPIYKYIIYFRLVIASSSQKNSLVDQQDVKDFQQLLIKTNNIARIALDDVFNSQMFIFPDGAFSASLGLETIATSEIYFHGLLFTCDSPEFQILTNSNQDTFEEQIQHQFLLQQAKLSQPNHPPVLSRDILQKICKHQMDIQSQSILAQVSPNPPDPSQIKYPPLYKVTPIEPTQTPSINHKENILDNSNVADQSPSSDTRKRQATNSPHHNGSNLPQNKKKLKKDLTKSLMKHLNILAPEVSTSLNKKKNNSSPQDLPCLSPEDMELSPDVQRHLLEEYNQIQKRKSSTNNNADDKDREEEARPQNPSLQSTGESIGDFDELNKASIRSESSVYIQSEEMTPQSPPEEPCTSSRYEPPIPFIPDQFPIDTKPFPNLALPYSMTDNGYFRNISFLSESVYNIHTNSHQTQLHIINGINAPHPLQLNQQKILQQALHQPRIWTLSNSTKTPFHKIDNLHGYTYYL